MTEAQNQVTSLELSKALKKAGYPQKGIWAWREIPHSKYEKENWDIRPLIWDKNKPLNGEYVAPTVAELGERLPDYCNSYYDSEKWGCNLSTGSMLKDTIADTEANARAKMWLYLKKEKLI